MFDLTDVLVVFERLIGMNVLNEEALNFMKILHSSFKHNYGSCHIMLAHAWMYIEIIWFYQLG